jgi:hypothetical protein
MSQIKLKDEELKGLQQLREKYATATAQFGQLKIEKMIVQKELDRLHVIEQELERQYLNIQQEEETLVKAIEASYGQGDVDLETGIFTPVQ